uniref:Late expression factor 11 n=1 Tax=Plutella xylostella granulovirus TaxID=98383 RepID=A0A1B2CSF7_9BBAC|nr:PlxyGVORF46 protein [Plutella xylostella granulovirus]
MNGETLLTRSKAYAVLRETINYRKSKFDTNSVVAHVEEPQFCKNSSFINDRAHKIFIQQPDSTQSIASHKDKLNHLFNLPKTLDEEYEYCRKRNGF